MHILCNKTDPKSQGWVLIPTLARRLRCQRALLTEVRSLGSSQWRPEVNAGYAKPYKHQAEDSEGDSSIPVER